MRNYRPYWARSSRWKRTEGPQLGTKIAALPGVAVEQTVVIRSMAVIHDGLIGKYSHLSQRIKAVRPPKDKVQAME